MADKPQIKKFRVLYTSLQPCLRNAKDEVRCKREEKEETVQKDVSKLRLGDLTKCKGYLYQIGHPFEHFQPHFLQHKSNFLCLLWLVM